MAGAVRSLGKGLPIEQCEMSSGQACMKWGRTNQIIPLPVTSLVPGANSQSLILPLVGNFKFALPIPSLSLNVFPPHNPQDASLLSATAPRGTQPDSLASIAACVSVHATPGASRNITDMSTDEFIHGILQMVFRSGLDDWNISHQIRTPFGPCPLIRKAFCRQLEILDRTRPLDQLGLRPCSLHER